MPVVMRGRVMSPLQHVLFFSRGKGRGHAVPDAAIASDLVGREPDVKITFASYGMGAATLKSLGKCCLRLTSAYPRTIRSGIP